MSVIILAMMDWWQSLTDLEHVYLVVAVVASLLLILTFVLSVFGGDVEMEGDIDFDVDAPDGLAEMSIISIKSVLAFFTMGGWTGVILSLAGVSVPWVVFFSVVLGFSSLFMVGYLTKFLYGLSESGNLKKDSLVGLSSKVYIPIPANLQGEGKIHVMIDGALREYSAMTAGRKLEVGEIVRIREIGSENVFIVEQA